MALTTASRRTYGAIPGVPIGSWWQTRCVCRSRLLKLVCTYLFTGRLAARMPFMCKMSRSPLDHPACSPQCSPWVAGIAPGPQGAYSIALSGGYEDDQDYGDGLYVYTLSSFLANDSSIFSTYTGSGGRDLKGTKDKPKNVS